MEAARESEARARKRQRLVLLGIMVVIAVVVVVVALVLTADDEDTAATDASTTVPLDDPPATDPPPTDSLPSDSTEPATTPSLPDPPPGATIEGETPCPADDGSEERVATFAQAPPTCIAEGEALEAEIVTSTGPITVALDAEAAPVMVNNFVVLARYKFFDGLPFHRLVPDFVAQTGSSGIPDYGSGGPGYDQEDIEKPTDGYAPGDLAMARSDAVSGSQFFLVASEAGADQLTNEYPVFGRVTEGMDLVVELASLGDAATNGTPTEVVTMDSVTIRPAG